MKAVILAGGEGSRLRPLTLGRPKPMTPLFGKPVLGHILDLLRRHGVTDIAVTLRYLPAAVTDYFGDGSGYGVKLTYFVEKEPLGTAGAVRACDGFLDEDFLVVSGDAVCDLDLTELVRRHKKAGAVASLALCRRSEPLEYGLVRTTEDGRVVGFAEKPGWAKVDTELVNTGVYVLSPRALRRVRKGESYDFGKELFPTLLAQGEALYGWEIPGYWQDMGDCKAYLECVCDALEGKIGIDLGRKSAIPAGVVVRPPCWVGERAVLAPGCTIGPFAVIGDGSTVETGAVVERSVLLGANVGEGAEVTGAILCKGVNLHPRAMVNPGAVLGEGVTVGAEAIVAPGVKLWPGAGVAEGAKATTSRLTAGVPEPIHFSGSALFHGVWGEELTAQSLLALGSILGESGRVGLGWSGGEAAATLAHSAACGVAAAGGSALLSDAPCPSALAWLGGYYALPVSLFIAQDGERCELSLTGACGLPLERGQCRKLEGALLRGEGGQAPVGRVGKVETVTGTGVGYAAEASRRCRLSGMPLRSLEVAVPRAGEVNDILAAALTGLGCRVSRGQERGKPILSADWGGRRLTAWDESGRVISPERILVLLTLIEFRHGAGAVALPAWAPAAADTVAEAFGGVLLRLDADGERAMKLWEETPWFRDAIFAACRICARLGETGETLAALSDTAPHFAVVRGEVALRHSRGRVMERLGNGAGSRRPAGEGWVSVTPVSRREAVRIVAESASMEAAAELCALFEKKVRQADGEE